MTKQEKTETSMDKFMNENITISKKEIVLLVKAAVSYWLMQRNWNQVIRSGCDYGVKPGDLFRSLSDRLRFNAKKLGFYTDYFVYDGNMFYRSKKELTDDWGVADD